ncbi:MAG: cytochrome c biogenesis protein ResB [Candidatus Krumholzibacteriia bacterium]
MNVKRFWQNPVVGALASLKLSAVLLAAIAFATGYATFFETRWGRDGAYAVVYGARWFELVLGLLTLNLLLALIRRAPYRARQTGFVMVHAAIVVILVGAAMTRYLGYEGIMRIREGESTDFIFSDRDYVQATTAGVTTRYPVRLYRPGEQDVAHQVEIAGGAYELGVAEFWPRYEEGWSEDPTGQGPMALQYGVTGPGGVQMETVTAGQRVTVGGTDLAFHPDALPDAATTSRYGDLRVRAGGEVCRAPVTPPPGEPVRCGGFTLEITEFQSDFKVGGTPTADGPLLNPMIRLRITGPDGATAERMLFAFHPDFAMNHQQDDAFAALDLAYTVERGLALAPDGRGGLVARAGFPLMVQGMDDPQARRQIPAGDEFPLELELLYASLEQGFSFMPGRILASARRAPVLSENQNAPTAARVYLEGAGGERAEAVVVKGTGGRAVTLGDHTVQLAFGPVIRQLPYRLHLDEFLLKTYPGSDNPASYESWVRVYDEEQGVDGERVRIWMNHPLNHRGAKHFQSSYDRDRQGTILSVNYDPGKWPTYVGYTLITLGFLLVLLRDLIWPARRPSGLPGAADARGSEQTIKA